MASCPPLPDYRKHLPQLPDLGRRLRICCPCVGIDGAGHALQTMGCGSSMHNVYDLVHDYREALTSHFQEMGMEVIRLNLGKKAGDILKVPLQELEKPIDFLVSGPPCPPWAGQGKRQGCKDPRSHVFMTVISWVAYLIATGGLLGCVLENVVGITHVTRDGREPVSEKFLRALRLHCPSFVWTIDRLDLANYLTPQSRVRIFIRGLRKIIAAIVPPPLPGWGRRHLREALAANMPHTPRSAWTAQQQKNILDSEELVISEVQRGKLEMDDIVVVPADRSHDFEMVYESKFSCNVCPTLTTHNNNLIVMSVQDVVRRTKDSSREFFRKLLLPERLQLQGFPASLALRLPENKITFASGNAYPVPLIIASLFPMIAAVGNSDVALSAWPPPEALLSGVPSCISKLARALASPGRLVDKSKHEKAQRCAKRKRCDSEDF